MSTAIQHVALIGFGEVGQIFARDLARAGAKKITVFDIAFGLPDAPQKRAAGAATVEACASAVAAVSEAPLVISAVTAGASLDAARSVIPGISPSAFYLDINSVSPNTKREAATIIEAARGRYVEAAVMASVPPHGIKVPILLGGPHSAALIAAVHGLGFDLTEYSQTIGVASSVKMCRSIMIKGMEALVAECMLSARRYGVEDAVIRSLSDTLPHEDWAKLAHYMIGRSLQHGFRRAEEMREVVKTVADVGIEPLMSERTVIRQEWAAERGKRLSRETIAETSLAELVDAILNLDEKKTRAA